MVINMNQANIKSTSTPPNSKANGQAMEETLRLYHAWLAVLLGRLEQKQLRVNTAEIKNALGQLHCSVCKEGDEYVICIGDPETPPAAKESDTHDQER